MLCVALVDKDGNEKWRISSLPPANTFIDYLVSDGNLLLWFNSPGSKSNSFRTTVYNIELLKRDVITDNIDKG